MPMPGDSHLSHQAMIVLEMIAAGSSYEQILSAHPHLTYLDIFDAAREALDLSVVEKPAAFRPSTPPAHQPWTDAADRLLRHLAGRGLTVAQIANRLQRQRSAIRSRIIKLNLVELLSPHEQSELHRISALDPKEPDGVE